VNNPEHVRVTKAGVNYRVITYSLNRKVLGTHKLRCVREEPIYEGNRVVIGWMSSRLSEADVPKVLLGKAVEVLQDFAITKHETLEHHVIPTMDGDKKRKLRRMYIKHKYKTCGDMLYRIYHSKRG